LHASILDALIPYEDEGRLKIIYGADTIDIQENGDGVTLIFPDNQTFTGDLLLAADGIHSFTR
jgi:2-polyprenyl-6-methoxyphenol hydroxylase-like FAD-dependent oxidoreductase